MNTFNKEGLKLACQKCEGLIKTKGLKTYLNFLNYPQLRTFISQSIILLHICPTDRGIEWNS